MPAAPMPMDRGDPTSTPPDSASRSPELEPAYAHSPDRPGKLFHLLRDHLDEVARLAAHHASAWHAEDWARLAGLWHDLGKYTSRFQAYLRGQALNGGEHSIAGALLAHRLKRKRENGGAVGALVAVIAGHHAGLADPEGEGRPKPLKLRLDEADLQAFDEALRAAPGGLTTPLVPPLPARFLVEPADKRPLHRSLELWARFLFSALVDADFLDTERYHRCGEREDATAGFDSMSTLRQRLDAHIDGLAARATPSDVNRVRAEILAACRTRAADAPGFFSLSAPTGGGKTLAAMSFALRHAETNGHRRVIAVIPLLSILEQNASVYREALGDRQVIEHHSALDPEKESRRNKLASENWDAPVIVTTAVQLFESLFANRTSKCRKIHNVARCVIVLDEAQTLPPRFLEPILDVLRELVDHYGCTVVLSTATQPALAKREGFPLGLTGIREIVSEPAALLKRLRRYEVAWPPDPARPVMWEDLAAELEREEQVLAITHLRADARDLAKLMPPGTWHLSATMCPAHRAEVLAKVRRALDRSEPCRLVSTQVVEAGVDVDFPVVYRALGGLDSLIQAAGRCNREGRRSRGRLVVFRAPTTPPSGNPRRGLEVMEMLLGREGGVEVEDPSLVEAYFRQLYHLQPLDGAQIQVDRARSRFATVAFKMRLLDDAARPIVVPWGEAGKRLERLRQEGPNRSTLRGLQPFTVSVYPPQHEQLRATGAIEVIWDTVDVLTAPFGSAYDPSLGLLPIGGVNADPVALYVDA